MSGHVAPKPPCMVWAHVCKCCHTHGRLPPTLHTRYGKPSPCGEWWVHAWHGICSQACLLELGDGRGRGGKEGAHVGGAPHMCGALGARWEPLWVHSHRHGAALWTPRQRVSSEQAGHPLADMQAHMHTWEGRVCTHPHGVHTRVEGCGEGLEHSMGDGALTWAT